MNDTIKMKDKIKIGKVEDLKNNIGEMINKVEALSKKIKAKDVKNEKIIVLNNIVVKLIEYLEVYKICIEYNVEILGFITRNLFELNLVTRFILRDDKNLKTFISELLTDRKDICEGFMGLSENRANNSYAILINQVREIEKKANEKGYELKKPTKVFKMAKDVEVLDEYNIFYKFFSKYSHATSFVINADPSEKYSIEYRNILIIQAGKYAGDIVYIIEKELKKHNNCEE